MWRENADSKCKSDIINAENRWSKPLQFAQKQERPRAQKTVTREQGELLGGGDGQRKTLRSQMGVVLIVWYSGE